MELKEFWIVMCQGEVRGDCDSEESAKNLARIVARENIGSSPVFVMRSVCAYEKETGAWTELNNGANG